MTDETGEKTLLVGVSVAALATSAAISAAELARRLSSFTDGVQTFLVPETGEYEITVAGAQGGSSSDGNAGGMGAIVGGDIFLRQNEVLEIYVGGGGSSSVPGYAGGGGGGTFLGNLNKVFFIAGGGGGGGSGGRSVADGRWPHSEKRQQREGRQRRLRRIGRVWR